MDEIASELSVDREKRSWTEPQASEFRDWEEEPVGRRKPGPNAISCSGCHFLQKLLSERRSEHVLASSCRWGPEPALPKWTRPGVSAEHNPSAPPR